MEFLDVLENRRSIRKYLSKDVSDADINKLIEAARLSQSAKNRQPWLFKVLRGQDKDKVAEFMANWCERNDLDKEKKQSGFNNSVKNTANVILQAPVLILVLREPGEFWKTGDLLSIGAAIEHISLRATDMGLGSLWIRDTVYVEDEILKFERIENLELVSAISIGFANEIPHPRPRKKLEELILK